jgi:CRP/FNR family transcriptional regulator
VLSTTCLLGDARYNAHGACESDVELALLPRELFDRLIAEHRPFRTAVFSQFGERLVRLVELAEAVGFQRVEQRPPALRAIAAGDPPSVTKVTEEEQAGQ